MADSYYYQANEQTIGPLTPAALKQLANEGVIGAATPVRKGEQGAWYQAGTIAGLIPPKPAEAGASPSFETDPAERARQTLRKAEEQAEKVAAKLWFLDLKFSQFFTPKLVGAVGHLLVPGRDPFRGHYGLLPLHAQCVGCPLGNRRPIHCPAVRGDRYQDQAGVDPGDLSSSRTPGAAQAPGESQTPGGS